MRQGVHHVVLSTEQHAKLRSIAFSKTHKLRQVLIARALLKVAAGQSDADVAEALEMGKSTVGALRRKFAREGLEACLNRREQERRFRKVTGDAEARILQVACSKPPEGRCRWTLQLLADRVVELGIVESLSDEGLCKILKKRAQASPRRALLHPAGGERRVRSAHGGRAGRVPAPP